MSRPGVAVDARRSGFVLPRHPGDAVRIALAAAIIVVTALLVHRDHVAVLEVDVFRVFNDLPAWVFPLLWPVMQAGNLVAVPVVAAATAATRRFRLAAQIAAAGTGVWLLAKVVKGIIVRDRPTALLDGVHVHGALAAGRGYLSGHAAVVAAMATLLIPYLGRRWRRAAASCLVIVGVARMYVGAHLPLDVIGGAALGWGVGSAVHLLLGAPSGRPRPAAVLQALRRLGLEPTSLTAVGLDARRSALFEAALADGDEVFVKVIPQERRDRDLLYRAWRFPRLAMAGEGPARRGRDQLEHEALVALLAARAGARVPRVVAVGGYGHGGGLLVYERVDGEPLPGHTEPRAAVADAWTQLDHLHAAGVAHRDLSPEHLFVDATGRVHLVGLGEASVAASTGELAADVDRLLAVTTGIVGATVAREMAGSRAQKYSPAERAASWRRHTRTRNTPART